MPYELLGKPLTAGGHTYYPGDTIPDGILFPERIEKLKRIGRISEVIETGFQGEGEGLYSEKIYTQAEADNLVSEAIKKATGELEARLEESRKLVAESEAEKAQLQQAAAEIQVPGFSSFDGVIQIPVKGEADGENEQVTVVPASPEEIKEFFAIAQLNAEEGARAIADVKNENVLILLHAADSRKTIKNAAKEQAGKLFQPPGDLKESTGGNEPTGTDTKGDDT